EMSFEALESEASFDRVLFDGGEYGAGGMIGSEDEQEFLGIPGLLDADQMRTVLQQQQAQQQARRQKSGSAGAPVTPGVVDHRQLMELRKELSTLVSAWAKKTGTPHGTVHNTLRSRSGRPAVAQASAEQIQERIAIVRGWFVGRRRAERRGRAGSPQQARRLHRVGDRGDRDRAVVAVVGGQAQLGDRCRMSCAGGL